MTVEDDTMHSDAYNTNRPFDEVVAEARSSFPSTSGWTMSGQGRFVNFVHVPGINGGLKTGIMVADLIEDKNDVKHVTRVQATEVKKYLP